jgi:predicted nuclease of predicted toxin-antitoxin system
MVRLYTDEHYPLGITLYLRRLGYNVLTVQDAGQAGQKIPDPDVLAFAIAQNRAVITQNRKDFIRLHRLQPEHAGIIACTFDPNWEALAYRVDEAIAAEESLQGKLIRVVRPSWQA